MDMSAAKTDVASTLVSTLFSLEPLSFDVAKAYDTLDHIATCSECEDFIDTLEEIIDTLQNREFKEYIEDIKKLNAHKFPTAPSPSPSKAKRSKNKRATVSPTPGTAGKKQRAIEPNRSGNPTPSPTPIAHAESEAMEGESSSDESSSETKNTKAATPVVAVSARDSAKSDGNLTDTEDEEFTLVSRKKKIASIVIDASQNTTGLLNTLSSHIGSTLEGRFENGKLRVFPKTIIEHRKLQSYLQAKKMRSHTFEMADNKQLKAVIRGLPTDFDQKEIATELKGFGFDTSHISILRNRKTNTNMPLFLVVLKRTQENKEIFHITNIGFFRVVIEPLKGSQMPPQCYRCQEFFHPSRLCNRAPKCLKCSGSHLTAECKKSAKSPAKCANCGGPHPANFSGCPNNPINRKQQKDKPKNNIWTEKAKARAQKATPQQQKPQSYASAVAKNITPSSKDNTFDANSIMQQMALMMTQRGTLIAALQENSKK
ncbi:nucleic-acid-binding protein from transposon X-element [Trichonephila inaurata madagascariensis]|uniref:Nucleic-acid-binding protein from transposon X-element n=1 Tax=Trichonephila inaurata madagascariensis TaxID=2747483 RepID=A0A8X6X7V6_9ARAC|nr:nucleic-acid-binding protein from transposon X-element [Trichonephila inaurata madagascariensis]